MIKMGVKGNGKWEVPRNIRQVGEGGKDKKIYLEDYAVTYMHQVKEAALLGEMVRISGVRYYFVDGAVEFEKSLFDEGSWEKVYETVKEKFPGRQVIGWYIQEDGLPQSLSEEGKKLYKQQFGDKEALVVVYDEEEKEEGVYLTLDGFLRRQKGYYIYYEKNQQMQDYMVEKNQGKSVEKEAAVSDKAIQSFRKMIDLKKEKPEKAKADTEQKTEEKPKLSFAFKPKEKEETQKAPKPSRLLYAASSFMVLTILIIGVTMINNYDKMKKMEETMAEMAGNSVTVNGTASGEETETGSSALKKTVIDVRTGETETELLEGVLTESEPQLETESDVSAMSTLEEEASPASSVWLDESNDGIASSQSGISSNTAADSAVSSQDDSAANLAAEDPSEETMEDETQEALDQMAGTTSEIQPETGTAAEAANTENGMEASAQVHASNASYTIKIGDTLAEVCQMYYGSLDKLEEICELNGIENANQIMPGQKILLP